MQSAISRLFLKHQVNSPKLVEDLQKLFKQTMIGSREFGKRVYGRALNKEQEERVWNDIQNCCDELKESDNSVFAKMNFEALKENYRIMRK